MSWLVVGLGNPGNEYSATRHNIGFQVADYLAGQVAGKFSKHKSKAEVLEGRFGVGVDAPKIIIAKPQTYMNDSGKSVVALRNFYQLSNSQIIVIHDELDMTGLQAGSSLYAADVKLPAGVILISDPKMAVVHLSVRSAHEEPVAVAAPAEGAAAPAEGAPTEGAKS